MAELSDVPLGDLMKELQRRLECSYKPKKHLILIGALALQQRIALGFGGWLLSCRSFALALVQTPSASTGSLDADTSKLMQRNYTSCRPSWLRQGHAVAGDQVRALPLPLGHR